MRLEIIMKARGGGEPEAAKCALRIREIANYLQDWARSEPFNSGSRHNIVGAGEGGGFQKIDPFDAVTAGDVLLA